MESLYHDTHRKLQSIQHNFGRLEVDSRDPSSIHTAEHQLENQIDQISESCDRLDTLVSREPVQRRSTAKHRVEQLKHDVRQCRVTLSRFQQRSARLLFRMSSRLVLVNRYAREQQDRDRDILLATNFTANADTAITIDDAALTHHSRLGNVHREIDGIIDTAKASTSSLFGQRSTLKNAQKRMLDIAATLGLSTVTMRAIERRVLQDKWIMRVGMVVSLLVMFLLWRVFS